MRTIEIAPDDWGDTQIADIKTLLLNVASHFDRFLLSPTPSGHIIVKRKLEGPPLIAYRDHESDPHFIYLPTGNRFWSQFSYQFAHEYFHFLSGYERLRHAKHKWFEEVLGEVASLYALRQMSISWKTQPPYDHWALYSESLAHYAAEVCARPSRALANGTSAADFFRQHEAALLADPYQRELNGTLAVTLLPFFETDPSRWELVRHIPIESGGFSDFLRAWHLASPDQTRAGVVAISRLFGHDTGSTETREAEQVAALNPHGPWCSRPGA